MSGNRACRICGSSELRINAIGGVDIVHCENCDIYYNAHFPTDNELAQYYRDEYKITEATHLETERRRLARLPEQIELIAEIMSHVKASASLLDVGCDKGYFIDEARRWGYACEGVEPSESARMYCSTVGLNVYKGISDVHNKYDVLTFWHSFEHFTEPKSVLELARERMTDGAYILIRVPAFDSVWSSLLKSRWIWFQPGNHYFHYTHRSLVRLLEGSGFEIKNVVSRRPNNTETKRAHNLSVDLFRTCFNYAYPFKRFLAKKYQDITGVELFAIARKL